MSDAPISRRTFLGAAGVGGVIGALLGRPVQKAGRATKAANNPNQPPPEDPGFVHDTGVGAVGGAVLLTGAAVAVGAAGKKMFHPDTEGTPEERRDRENKYLRDASNRNNPSNGRE